MKDITLSRIARLVDDLLQEIGELLHDGDGLAAGETDAVHGSRGVVGGLAQPGWRASHYALAVVGLALVPPVKWFIPVTDETELALLVCPK